MMIRHAEKAAPDRGGVHESGEDDAHSLAVDGWKRAGALVGLFAPLGGRALPEPRLARPAYLFAESADAPGSDPKLSKREEQTLAPMAEVLGVEPNFSFGRGHEAEVAAAAKACTGPVLIAWEHNDLFDVAREIAKDARIPTEWPKSRNDIVLVFRLGEDRESYSFEQVPQLLLAGDIADPIEV